MHDDGGLIEARIARLLHDRVEPNLYRRRIPVATEAWQVPDEPVPFEIAEAQQYSPVRPGTPWGGKPWGTTWFRVSGTVPEGFGAVGTAVELIVDLGFSRARPGFQAEGLVWTTGGRTVKAIEPLNAYVPIDAGAGARFEFYLEAAANPYLGGDGVGYDPTPLGSKATAGYLPIYTLQYVDLAERDLAVWELDQDIRTLSGLVEELPSSSSRRADILRALERAADAIEPDRVAATAVDARECLRSVLSVPAAASAQRMIASGHAHIDSAWLWPVRETIRKCARTFTNVLDLMDRYPDFVFACSSAQQYAWMRDHYPSLFARIRERVAEGRWVPVGGMWVESDTNLPGGEALVRQLVLGKRFFLDEFGYETPEVWLPDSFGYTAAMPQLVRRSGSRWFVTQKQSWNESNTMPHTSFLWEGIDGSRVLTHMPPADNYNSDISASDLARGARNNKEKGVSNVSLLLYGYGDGGGGPTREMLAAAHRTRDLDGSPRVELGSPVTLFEELEASLPDPAVWSGEMYLEFHRGTYTSQARTKRGNRRSEHLLREAELWAATATTRLGIPYPYEELRESWEVVLLQQFHDVLPGSSIAWVYEVAEENYARIAEVLEGIIRRSLAALARGTVSQTGAPADDGPVSLRFNAAPVAVEGIAPMGAAVAVAPSRVEPQRVGDEWVLDTGAIRAVIDGDGLIRSIVDRATGREVIAAGERGGLLTVFQDTPNQWDAWDIDRTYRRKPTELTAAASVSATTDAVVVVREFGQSTVASRYSAITGAHELLIETEVDWHEQQKLLKLGFPLDVKADTAASEIQFGHVNRPTHQNTSWDFARFETVAHRWLHVGEPGFGIAIANDSTYGHDVTRQARADGGITTLVRESLLRAPLYPDPHADQGTHTLRTAIRVAPSVLEAAESGYRMNIPIREVEAQAGAGCSPLVSVEAEGVFIESVKLAEDRSGDVVIRFYEARGARVSEAGVTLGFDAKAVWRTDLLERELDPRAVGAPDRVRWDAGEPITTTVHPFEIVTLRARPSAGGRHSEEHPLPRP